MTSNLTFFGKPNFTIKPAGSAGFSVPKLGSSEIETKVIAPFFEGKWAELLANMEERDEFHPPILDKFLAGIKQRLGPAKRMDSIQESRERLGDVYLQCSATAANFMRGEVRFKAFWRDGKVASLHVGCQQLNGANWCDELAPEFYVERGRAFWRAMYQNKLDVCMNFVCPPHMEEMGILKQVFNHELNKVQKQVSRFGTLQQVEPRALLANLVPKRDAEENLVFSIDFTLNGEAGSAVGRITWIINDLNATIHSYSVTVE